MPTWSLRLAFFAFLVVGNKMFLEFLGDGGNAMTHTGETARLVHQATIVHQETILSKEPSSDSGAPSRFAPGTLLAGRYRIVSALGRGGMGEVYRANDLELGEVVALKFLPEAVAHESKKIEIMLSEVRIARKVSHPNVCRVHDLEVHTDDSIGELRFISMEYIEGEDLASLGRRIGRFPKAKALEIASEICAGLAAVHDTGLRHRDIKPSNVMIDHAGHARLTDFGLAQFDREPTGKGGTPAYMAPEQFASGPSTVRSDIYALGLVLYELFTGSRAFKARSPVEYAWKHIEQLPDAPSTRWPEIDPEVETIILGCLEKIPERRPASVHAVAEALQTIDPEGPTPPREAPDTGEALRALLLCDLVGSTALVESLGDRQAAELFERHDRLARDLLKQHDGREIDKTDGFLLLFEHPLQALRFALDYHEALGDLAHRVVSGITARVGIHFGDVWLRENSSDDIARGAKPLEVEGLAKAVAARLMSLAGGRQTLLSRGAFDLARRAAVGLEGATDLRWLDHGAWQLHGVADPIDVFEVGREGEAPLQAPAETEKVRRLILQPRVDGWRPAPGLEIPQRRSWRLERRLGEGGFGEVWLAKHLKTDELRSFKFCFDAERLRSLQREITLFRLLKEGLGERDDINRILDWNLDEAPYFIESEYSSAGSLVEWAEAQGGLGEVPLADRLELVAQVADALAAAHSVGVLHKDIKPSNVLIQPTPDGFRAQVADFGIGQVTERERLAAAGFTVLGMSERTPEGSSASGASGTRLYMAPELLEGQMPTLQADIYALGVMLYQLMVGDLRRVLAPGWRRDVDDELLAEDIACFVDRAPERRPANALEVAARLRRLEERRRERQAEAETQKALAASQRRRKIYKVVFAASLSALAVVSSLAFWAIRVGEEEKQAREATQRVLDYMVGLFEITDPSSTADPGESRGETVTAREILDRGTERVEVEFEDQPLIRAQLMATFGNIYTSLGLYGKAQSLLEQSLATRQQFLEQHPDVATGFSDLGNLFEKEGEYEKALSLYRQARDLRQELLGAEHPKTLESVSSVAWNLMRIGKYKQSKTMYEENLQLQQHALGSGHLTLTKTMHGLAISLKALGQYAEAREIEERVLEIRQRELGTEHPETLGAMHNLAVSLKKLGQMSEAEAMEEHVLRIYENTLGSEHPNTLDMMNHLADSSIKMGKYLRAKTIEERALEIKERVLGPQHPSTLITMGNLADSLAFLGQYREAETIFEFLLESYRQTLGPEHPRTLLAMCNLASTLSSLGQYPEARALNERALESMERVRGKEHLWTLRSMRRFARTLWQLDNIEEAQRLAREALGGQTSTLGPQHPETTETQELLLEIAIDTGDTDAIARWLDELRWLAESDESSVESGSQREVRRYVLDALASESL